MFHVLDREREWRRAHNRDEGFGGLRKHLPLLAVGAAGPFLKDQKVVADYFRKEGDHTRLPDKKN